MRARHRRRRGADAISGGGRNRAPPVRISKSIEQAGRRRGVGACPAEAGWRCEDGYVDACRDGSQAEPRVVRLPVLRGDRGRHPARVYDAGTHEGRSDSCSMRRSACHGARLGSAPAYGADIVIYLGHPTIGLRYHKLGIASCIIIGVWHGLSVGLCVGARGLCFLADRAERRARARASCPRRTSEAMEVAASARDDRLVLSHLPTVEAAANAREQAAARSRRADAQGVVQREQAAGCDQARRRRRSAFDRQCALARAKWWSGAAAAVTPLVPGAPHWRVKGLLDALEALLG